MPVCGASNGRFRLRQRPWTATCGICGSSLRPAESGSTMPFSAELSGGEGFEPPSEVAPAAGFKARDLGLEIGTPCVGSTVKDARDRHFL